MVLVCLCDWEEFAVLLFVFVLVIISLAVLFRSITRWSEVFLVTKLSVLPRILAGVSVCISEKRKPVKHAKQKTISGSVRGVFALL